MTGEGKAQVTWTYRNLVGQSNLLKIKETKERTTKETENQISIMLWKFRKEKVSRKREMSLVLIAAEISNKTRIETWPLTWEDSGLYSLKDFSPMLWELESN